MKAYFLFPVLLFTLSGFAQNVGIGTTTPLERLHVIHTADINKNTIYGYASQTSAIITDYQNTGVTGFGQGNGTANSYGYGFGVKGIGSTNSWGAIGVYAGLATSVPNLSFSNNFYALYADAGTAAANRHAAVFLNGNVGINIPSPVEKLDVGGNIQATGTIKGSSYTFATPKTYYYSLSGSDFISKSTSDYSERETISNGGVFMSASNTFGLTAAVHLPHGAIITRMTLYFVDNSATVNLQVGLRRNSSSLAMASLTTSGIYTGSITTTTFSSNIIDNSLNAYIIDADSIGGGWPNVNLVLRNIILEYTQSAL